MKRAKDWIGIRRHGPGWEVRVQVQGRSLTRQYPLDTAPSIMQAWRRSKKGRALARGTLGDWAQRYLAMIQHMPDQVNRTVYLAHWLAALGADRHVHTITADEINTVMSRWLTEPQPRQRGPAKPYSPVTVRHHRTTLLHLWKRLDPAAENPVAQTFRPRDPAPEARAPALADVQAILDRMRPSKTRARLMLILTTGLPHQQIKQLKPADWDQARRMLRVTARRKGGGAKGRWLPLSPLGQQAMRQFHRLDAYGSFSASAMHSNVAWIAKRYDLTPWTPYQLRHLHGTLAYQATGDLATVARLLGHSRLETAARYAAAAFAQVDRKAAAAVAAQLLPSFAPPKRQKTRGGESRTARFPKRFPSRARSSVG